MVQQVINITITSIGRRVHLQSAIKNAMVAKGIRGRIIATDCSWSAPGLKFCDKGYEVPKSTDSNYIDALLNIIQSERVSFVIPANDIDLLVLSKAKDVFERYDVTLLAPSYENVVKCADKMESAKLFDELGLRTPKVFTDCDAKETNSFPLVVKGRGRKAAITKGFKKVTDKDELSYCLRQSS